MALLDHMSAVKSIPGYKLILTAVIKSQIQQLVEQLSFHSDEECVLLTANIFDGTMTHIGSESGKGFIHDHEDIKSKFLQFCFKDSYLKEMANNKKNGSSQVSFNTLHQSTANPVAAQTLNHTTTIMPTRTSINPRPKPYSTRRSRKKTLPDCEITEVVSNSYTQDERLRETADSTDCYQNSTILTDTTPTSVGTTLGAPLPLSEPGGEVDSFYLNMASQSQAQSQAKAQSKNSTISDTNTIPASPIVKVKIERDSEPVFVPLDLTEGTKPLSEGIKPVLADLSTQPHSDNTTCILDTASDIEIKLEATTQQFGIEAGNTTSGGNSKVVSTMKVYACDICSKRFPSRWELHRHRRTHTGERPYVCSFCSKAFSDKSNMIQHVKGVHLKETIRKRNNQHNNMADEALM